MWHLQVGEEGDEKDKRQVTKMEPNVNNWHEPQVMRVYGWRTGECWVTYFAK